MNADVVRSGRSGRRAREPWGGTISDGTFGRKADASVRVRVGGGRRGGGLRRRIFHRLVEISPVRRGEKAGVVEREGLRHRARGGRVQTRFNLERTERVMSSLRCLTRYADCPDVHKQMMMRVVMVVTAR